jgi:release factor glutamine methyltransferase
LDYEPHLALFVTDNEALRYYQHIIEFSKVHLQKEGLLFFEINEQKSVEIKEMLENNGFADILIKKDMQGKNRMVKAVRKL